MVRTLKPHFVTMASNALTLILSGLIVYSLGISQPIWAMACWSEMTFTSLPVEQRLSLFRELVVTSPNEVGELLLSESERVQAEIASELADSPGAYPYPYAEATGWLITTKVRDLALVSEVLEMKPGERFVDIGSGHGVPSLVLGGLNPEVEFIGYDISAPKNSSARRLAELVGVQNTEFIEADFSKEDFEVAPADYYYFFNPSSREAVAAAVDKILETNRGRTITVISYMYEDVLLPFINRGYGRPVRHQGTAIATMTFTVR
ncbi:MAG: methyltransferase domain-containing protein [Pseudomonadota bacterium]